jgi:two-component system LytT family response regulator
MKYNAIIVDDEKGCRESLHQLLEKFCKNIKVIQKVESVGEAYDSIRLLKPDLVFLDVEMQTANAFDLLEKFSSLDFDIIFTTAFNQYAINAIRFSALDYILKPVDAEDLLKAVDRFEQKKHGEASLNHKFQTLLNNIQPDSRSKRIGIPDGDSLVFIDVKDIIRCHSDGSYTSFHLIEGKKILASRPIGEYEELLQEERFFRVHRSFLVNLDHIRKYVKGDGGYVVMSDGAEVEVSRRKKNDFIAVLNRL